MHAERIKHFTCASGTRNRASNKTRMLVHSLVTTYDAVVKRDVDHHDIIDRERTSVNIPL